MSFGTMEEMNLKSVKEDEEGGRCYFLKKETMQ